LHNKELSDLYRSSRIVSVVTYSVYIQQDMIVAHGRPCIGHFVTCLFKCT